MDARDRLVHRIENAAAFGPREFRQARIPEDAPGNRVHDIEHAADHRFIGAQRMDRWDPHAGAREGRQHPEFTIDRVRARQCLANRTRPQNVFSRDRMQPECRVRLAAGNPLMADRPLEATDIVNEPARKTGRANVRPPNGVATSFKILPHPELSRHRATKKLGRRADQYRLTTLPSICTGTMLRVDKAALGQGDST